MKNTTSTILILLTLLASSCGKAHDASSVRKSEDEKYDAYWSQHYQSITNKWQSFENNLFIEFKNDKTITSNKIIGYYELNKHYDGRLKVKIMNFMESDLFSVGEHQCFFYKNYESYFLDCGIKSFKINQ